MKIHLITIGQPKLAYARTGWDEYFGRLKHYHRLRVTHIADRQNDAAHLLAAAGNSYKIAMVIEGQQFTSSELAAFLDKQALNAREISILIGGPEGLPSEVIAVSDTQWSLGKLTLPHDLAIVVTLEALYRGSTIGAGVPYHK